MTDASKNLHLFGLVFDVGPQFSVICRTSGHISDDLWSQLKAEFNFRDDRRDEVLYLLQQAAANVTEEVEFVANQLTDAQWHELQQDSQLSDEARVSVEYAIWLLKQLERAETQEALQARKKMMEDAEKLSDRLSTILQKLRKSNVLKGVVDREGNLAFELDVFSRYLKMRIGNFSPGRKNHGKSYVIKQLNHLLINYCGKCLHNNQPHKGDRFYPRRFVQNVFKFAHSAADDAFIMTLIDGVVTQMNSWEPEYRPGSVAETDRETPFRGPGWMYNA